jgi:hypothetical protein
MIPYTEIEVDTPAMFVEAEGLRFDRKRGVDAKMATPLEKSRPCLLQGQDGFCLVIGFS